MERARQRDWGRGEQDVADRKERRGEEMGETEMGKEKERERTRKGLREKFGEGI